MLDRIKRFLAIAWLLAKWEIETRVHNRRARDSRRP